MQICDQEQTRGTSLCATETLVRPWLSQKYHHVNLMTLFSTNVFEVLIRFFVSAIQTPDPFLNSTAHDSRFVDTWYTYYLPIDS